MKTIRGSRVLYMGLFTAALLSSVVASAAEIRFRSQARSSGAVVRLGDLADIITPDKREREALQAIELGPMGTSAFTLSAREVQDRLAAQGVTLANHEFSGARTTDVVPNSADRARDEQRPLSKSAMNLAKTAVVDAIVAYLNETGDADEEWLVEVDLTTEQARAIGPHARQITVRGGRAPWTGMQKFTIVLPNRDINLAVAVPAEVKRSPRAVIAVNAIARGERIRRDDIQLERVKAAPVQRSPYQSLDEVIGKEAARNIPAGQVLDSQYIRSPILVRRGDVVDLYARAAGVQVSTKARARDEGSHGDLIDVELLTDRRKLLARVCGIQEVEILAAAPAVQP